MCSCCLLGTKLGLPRAHAGDEPLEVLFVIGYQELGSVWL